MNPLISCKCITYGRVNTLEESIYSFLIQKDQNCEMIIVNDYPKQTLHFDHPRVRIINTGCTFSSIGEKENFAVSECKGELIAVWDDDDIALKNHTQNIHDYFTSTTSLLHWQNGMMINSGKISQLTSLGNSGIVYTKKVWQQLGGHALENAGYDMSFVLKIQGLGKEIIRANPPDHLVSWAYLWADRSYHMSGQGTDTPERPNVIERHRSYIENERLLGRIPTGDIYLRPHWKTDYQQMLYDYIKTNQHL